MVSHREPAPVRRGDPPAGRTSTRASLAEALNDSPAIPVAIVDREPLTDADAIRRVLAEASADDDCVGVIAWMHTFSPARMWIGGLDALRKPLLHLHTQFDRELPWARDRHGLHEPQPVGPRRPRVRLHRDAAWGWRARPSSATGQIRRVQRADRDLDRARRAAGRRPQRLRIARFGDNMRDVAVTEGDKVERPDHASASRSTATASTSSSDAVDARARGGRRGAARATTRSGYDARARAARRRRAARVAASRRRRSRSGLRRRSSRRRLRGLHRHLRGPAARLRQLPGHRRAAADGRRLRVRRRGRLEDGAARCACSR